jgi:hypothetical protein
MAEAKPNLSQLYLSRLSLAKPDKLNFSKTQILLSCRDGGHEQVISNGGMFKPAFAEIGKRSRQ